MSLTWIAAVLRPQAMFGPASVDAHVEPWNELAEAVLGRTWRRELRNQNHLWDSDGDAPPADPLLGAFAESIREDTIRAGVSQLRQTVLHTAHADHARLVATALLTCAAAAELDDYATCDAVLETGLNYCATDESPDANLLRAALFQQRALRNRDSGRAYVEDLNAAIDELERFQPELCEPFETTVANEDFVSTLQNIQQVMTDAAISLLPFEARGADRPPRSQPDQIQYLNAIKGEGYAGVLARNFAFQATGTPSGTSTLGPTDPFYVALCLELLGHQHVYSAREELAQIRFVDLQTQGQGNLTDVPRLLRHAGSKRELELMLSWLAANGPLEALLADSRQILSHRTNVYALRTLELRVLRASAALLNPDEKRIGREAIERALDAGGPFDLPGQHELRYLRAEQAWLTLASLADTVQSVERTSERLLVEARSADSADQLLDQALAAALSQLDWNVLRNGDISGWVEWLQSSSDEPSSRVRRVVEQRLGIVGEVNERHPLSAVAERVDRVILGLTDTAEFGISDVEIVRTAMRDTREQAANGMHSMGGIPEADVAAALITQSRITGLWPDLTAFLVDPLVLSEHKEAAFNRLAASRQPLPEETRTALSQHAQSLLHPPDTHSFIRPSIRPFPPALRLLAANDCIPHTEVVSAVSTLMQDLEAPARREAAITASFLLEQSEDPWLLGLVLHMSFDRDARVRAHAGQGLASNLSTTSTWDQFATDRVQALLTADGTTSVVAVLGAFVEAKSELPKVLVPTVEDLASNHISSTVRRTARDLLSFRSE